MNPLDAIDGKANVVSLDRFTALYPSGKIAPRSQDAGRLFVCRRGLDMRTTAYTDEFIWEDKYRGIEDLDYLMEYVAKSTKEYRGLASKKRRERSARGNPVEGPVGEQITPRKRQLSPSSPQRRFVQTVIVCVLGSFRG